MMPAEKTLSVRGRVFVSFKLRALTGLHIGGTAGGIAIGGVDNPVIRDPLTNRPYIPGSSLKGKIRSLLEKQYGKEPNWKIHNTCIHICQNGLEYKQCPVCNVFGVPAELDYTHPSTRLIVRDINLDEKSAENMEALPLDRPYTELKTEVSIDRITSAANPRPVERVPAGAVFGPGEFVYTVYEGDGLVDPKEDVERLAVLFEGMALLEHDYLGGMGSRGYGKVKFEEIKISLRPKERYFTSEVVVAEVPDLATLLARKDEIIGKIKAALGL